MRLLIAAAWVLSAGTAWALPGAGRFQTSFNNVAIKYGLPVRSGAAECDGRICEYPLAPRGRLSVVYGDSAKQIDEVAAYFSPDPIGGTDAVVAVNVLMRLFGSNISEPLRRAAVEELLAGATSPRRDGEITIGKWRYVVRPSDGRDVRIYVKAIE